MTVLVELASLKKILGALGAFALVGLATSSPLSSPPTKVPVVLGTLPVLPFPFSSFFAALENDLARFLKKFDADATTPPPLPLEVSVLVKAVAVICGVEGDES